MTAAEDPRDARIAALESALRSALKMVRRDACGCAAEYAFEIACGQIEPEQCHGHGCPVGRALAVLNGGAR